MSDRLLTLDDAWEALRWAAGCLVSLFGAPGEIALRRVLPHAMRRALLLWLRPLERLTRRLLLAAIALAPPANAGPPRGMGGGFGGYGRGGFASEDAADWAVRFRMDAAAPRSAPSRKRPMARRKAPRAFTPALALAERLEAVIRILADPQAAARARRRRGAATTALPDLDAARCWPFTQLALDLAVLLARAPRPATTPADTS